MSFTESSVSFPVIGNLIAHAGVGRLQPLAAVPVRVGAVTMAVGMNSWFSSAWWLLYVNDGDGMVVHCRAGAVGNGSGGPDSPGLGGSRVRIPPWTLAVLPAWMPWRIEMTAPTRHCFIQVDCPQVSSRQISALCRGAIVVPPGDGGVCVEVARALLAGRVEPGAGNEVLAGVHQAMAHLVPGFALESGPPRDLAAVMAAIDGHLGDDLRVTALARRVGVSAKTLTTLFQRHLGVTPAVFVRERRLAQACHLLRSSDEDINTVAKMVGFAGREYLSRLMQRAVGLPPGKYRDAPFSG
jgi:AraC-like DNA-binding protein